MTKHSFSFCVRMCICVYEYMRICVYVYMCICVYVYMSMCVYVYMCNLYIWALIPLYKVACQNCPITRAGTVAEMGKACVAERGEQASRLHGI